MNYKEKYIKYKTKYFNLKKMHGGLYKDNDGEEMIYKYKSTMPKGINDIVPNKNEHPFEKMAFEISEEYGRFKISKYKNI